MDLKNLSYKEDYRNIFKDRKVINEQYDVVSKLPLVYTYDTKGLVFGDVVIPENSENQIAMNSVGVLLDNVREKNIVGLKISIEGVDNCKKILDFIRSEYGNSMIIKKAPMKNNDGFFVGNSSYLWELNDKNKSILVSQNFGVSFVESGNGKRYSQSEGLLIFIINDGVKSDAQGYADLTTKELLVKTFSS